MQKTVHDIRQVIKSKTNLKIVYQCHLLFISNHQVLTRADGEGVGIEEMDNLQMELETMLVNVMQRARQLKMESMILDNLTGSDLNESLIVKFHSFIIFFFTNSNIYAENLN